MNQANIPPSIRLNVRAKLIKPNKLWFKALGPPIAIEMFQFLLVNIVMNPATVKIPASEPSVL
jgi:hypothetical protein